MQVLRASQDLAAAIQDWRGGDLYRPTASKPVLMSLYRYPDGSVGGFAQASNGQIIGQAKWVKATAMGARVAASATMLVEATPCCSRSVAILIALRPKSTASAKPSTMTGDRHLREP